MNKEQAIERAGGIPPLARVLGISRQAVHQWKDIPPLQVYRLKEMKPEWFQVSPVVDVNQ